MALSLQVPPQLLHPGMVAGTGPRAAELRSIAVGEQDDVANPSIQTARRDEPGRAVVYGQHPGRDASPLHGAEDAPWAVVRSSGDYDSTSLPQLVQPRRARLAFNSIFGRFGKYASII